MQFSQKLLELRKKRGFSQEDLAEKLNVSRQGHIPLGNGQYYAG